MKNIFWVIVLFLAAVALAFAVRINTGSVIFLLADQRIEISANFFIVLVLLLFAIMFVVFRILAMILGIPASVRRFKDKRAQKMFNRALLAFFEGQYSETLTCAEKSFKRGKWKGLSALLAAHAANSLENTDLQTTWLKQARQTDEECNAAASLLEAESHLKNAQFSEALQNLEQLPPKLAASTSALRLDLKARQGLKDGEGVLGRLKLLQKKGVVTEKSVESIKHQAILDALNQSTTTAELLKNFVRHLKTDSIEIASAAVEALLRFEEDDAAQKWIEKYLSQPTHLKDAAVLFDFYANLKTKDEAQRIAHAEKWLSANSDNSALLLALGKMCFRAQLWGKAQNYLEAAIALNQNVRAHLELAQLLDYLNRPEDANRHYRALAQL